MMKKCPKQPEVACPFYNIGAIARPMVAFSGFYESTNLLPIEMVSKVDIFCIFVLFAVALAAAAAIRSR